MANEQQKTEKIEWSAPEYIFYEKSSDWFWALGIITLGFFVSAIFLRAFLFAILVLLAGFSLALYGARRPEMVNFSAGPRGVQIKNRIYDYENLKSFWIEYNPPHRKELILESKKTFMPYITILIEDVEPDKLRNLLIRFLPEKKIEESLISTIARILGF